jgi:hypothetical protein
MLLESQLFGNFDPLLTLTGQCTHRGALVRIPEGLSSIRQYVDQRFRKRRFRKRLSQVAEKPTLEVVRPTLPPFGK